MKKILLSCFLTAAVLSFAVESDAQRCRKNCCSTNKQSFYYYPQSNVYYDVAARHYIYPGRNGWVRVHRLPQEFHRTNARGYAVYNYGPDIWRYNTDHIRSYRRYAPPSPARAVVYQPAPIVTPGVQISINATF